MKGSHPNIRMVSRCLLAASMVIATQLTIWQLQRGTEIDAREVASFDIGRLPMNLGDWAGQELNSDAEIVKAVGGIRMIERTYTNGSGDRRGVIVATFPTGTAILPHPPDLCYSGAGWNVLNETWRSDSHEHRYKLLRVERQQEVALVSFWYQLGSDVASNRDELRRILQKLRWRGEPFPPLVKVMIHAPVQFSEADARTASENLAAPIYDWIEEQVAKKYENKGRPGDESAAAVVHRGMPSQ